MPAALTEREVAQRLAETIKRNGPTLREASKKLGYSLTHLGRIRAGEYEIPEPILMEMNVRRVVVYEDISGK